MKSSSSSSSSSSLLMLLILSIGAAATATQKDADYVDIYNCKNINTTNFSDIKKAKYGCKYDSWASYLINRGSESYNNFTYLLENNSTFTKNYNAYIDYYQKQLLSNFTLWFSGYPNGKQYYLCDGSSTLTKCASETIKQSPVSNPLMGGISVSEGVCIDGYRNVYISNDKLKAAATSMSNYFNAKITADDIDVVSSKFSVELSEEMQECEIAYFQNVTMPKAMDIIPNPMAHITKTNVTDLQNIIKLARSEYQGVSGMDLVTILTPVVVFAQTSEVIMNINAIGAEIVKEESKERKLEIINLVFGFVGVATMFLGPLESIIANTVLGVADMLASWAVENTQMTPKEIGFGLLGVFLGVVGGADLGKGIEELANVFRFDVSSSLTKSMTHFSDFSGALSSIYGVSVGN
ncbi:hypothetical protein DASC09_055180 [Saccharomycopsis crataegensis]|uniref:Uncharacterized protein n=1 Tax=Saccharomycopsis crataegensis TaxID=43959 RepID=A0AAV5QTU1_9ASCO|nr:hypothetical protein DASC09_055180 [Saccharomycopsis crataegensis]